MPFSGMWLRLLADGSTILWQSQWANWHDGRDPDSQRKAWCLRRTTLIVAAAPGMLGEIAVVEVSLAPRVSYWGRCMQLEVWTTDRYFQQKKSNLVLFPPTGLFAYSSSTRPKLAEVFPVAYFEGGYLCSCIIRFCCNKNKITKDRAGVNTVKVRDWT